MQLTIQDMIQEHGFESPAQAIEWSVANGYKLHVYTDMQTHADREITPEEAAEFCETHPDRVFILANTLGFDNPSK